jgi:glycosyltransferase involved in cell wall biosynthesis
MTTICIDARLYGIAHTGIGRYVENLIKYLPLDKNFRVVLIISPENLNNSDLKKFPRFVARYHPYSPWAQLEMLWLWLTIRPDLLHVPHFSLPVCWPGPIVITIHDLIKHYSKGPDTTTRNLTFYWLKYLGYLVVVKIALTRAAQIIVPANYWKRELVRLYKISPNRISVTYEGVDFGLKPTSGIDEFKIQPPYVVYTGNVYPHKNLPVLISAIKLLHGQVHLAIVCARSVFASRLEKMILAADAGHLVTFLGRLTDSQVVSLYTRATAFVFPSLIEGFGLTGLEAMALGLPVIAARASCLPEIYGDAAFYFDPYNPQDLAERITEVTNNKPLREDLIKKGLLQVKKYSWAKMSQQTWQIYQTALL